MKTGGADGRTAAAARQGRRAGPRRHPLTALNGSRQGLTARTRRAAARRTTVGGHRPDGREDQDSVRRGRTGDTGDRRGRPGRRHLRGAARPARRAGRRARPARRGAQRPPHRGVRLHRAAPARHRAGAHRAQLRAPRHRRRRRRLLFGYNVFLGPEAARRPSATSSRCTTSTGTRALLRRRRRARPPRRPAVRSASSPTSTATTAQTRLLQLRRVDGKLLAVFQTGEKADDIRVLRWALDADGAATFLDARGERDHVFPPSHDFEWIADHPRGPRRSAATRTSPSRTRSSSRRVGGDLTVKVENNTETGEGIYARAGRRAAAVARRRRHRATRASGPLILLRDPPVQGGQPRYLVFNTLTRTVVRLDGIGQACRRLPEDQGIVFPGGYYLATGAPRPSTATSPSLEFERVVRSPNGEDVLFAFHARAEGRSLLLPYNLIRKEVATPLSCHGYALFDDGTLVVLPRRPRDEPTRVHPMQLWHTPFVSDTHAAAQPGRHRPARPRRQRRPGARHLRLPVHHPRCRRDDADRARSTRRWSPPASAPPTPTTGWASPNSAICAARSTQVRATAEQVLDEFETVQALTRQAADALDEAAARTPPLVRRLARRGTRAPPPPGSPRSPNCAAPRATCSPSRTCATPTPPASTSSPPTSTPTSPPPASGPSPSSHARTPSPATTQRHRAARRRRRGHRHRRRGRARSRDRLDDRRRACDTSPRSSPGSTSATPPCAPPILERDRRSPRRRQPRPRHPRRAAAANSLRPRGPRRVRRRVRAARPGRHRRARRRRHARERATSSSPGCCCSWRTWSPASPTSTTSSPSSRTSATRSTRRSPPASRPSLDDRARRAEQLADSADPHPGDRHPPRRHARRRGRGQHVLRLRPDGRQGPPHRRRAARTRRPGAGRGARRPPQGRPPGGRPRPARPRRPLRRRRRPSASASTASPSTPSRSTSPSSRTASTSPSPSPAPTTAPRSPTPTSPTTRPYWDQPPALGDPRGLPRRAPRRRACCDRARRRRPSPRRDLPALVRRAAEAALRRGLRARRPRPRRRRDPRRAPAPARRRRASSATARRARRRPALLGARHDNEERAHDLDHAGPGPSPGPATRSASAPAIGRPRARAGREPSPVAADDDADLPPSTSSRSSPPAPTASSPAPAPAPCSTSSAARRRHVGLRRRPAPPSTRPRPPAASSSRRG